MLTEAELAALAALESLTDDDADYVAVARDKLLLLCRTARGARLDPHGLHSAQAAEKIDRLERTVDEFARHSELARQKAEQMQERYRMLRQEILETREWLDGLDSLEEARRAGLRDGSTSMNHWRTGFETGQEMTLERLAGVPLVALTDVPVDRYIDVNALEHRIEGLERDLAHEREARAWLLERMNALGLALGMRSKLTSPDKLLRQALRLESIALAAERLIARLKEGAGASSEQMARTLGLVEAAPEIDTLANEVERWRNDPDTMRADPNDDE